MADYERSVERLQEDLKRSQELVQSKSNESSSIKKELGMFANFPHLFPCRLFDTILGFTDALRSQKAKTESNLAKLKTAFVKTRLELTTAQTDLEKKTAECDGLSDKLQEVTADVESTKVGIIIELQFVEYDRADGTVVFDGRRTPAPCATRNDGVFAAKTIDRRAQSERIVATPVRRSDCRVRNVQGLKLLIKNC
jgi:hypothetical protein